MSLRGLSFTFQFLVSSLQVLLRIFKYFSAVVPTLQLSGWLKTMNIDFKPADFKPAHHCQECLGSDSYFILKVFCDVSSCPVKVSHRSDWLPGPDVFHLRLIVSPGCVFISPCYSDDRFLLTLCLVCVILVCFDHWVMPADSASLLWYRTFCCMKNLELWILECAVVSLHDCAW